jgi:hypothetical protein
MVRTLSKRDASRFHTRTPATTGRRRRFVKTRAVRLAVLSDEPEREGESGEDGAADAEG